jgi:hypothetical protein
MVHDIVTIQRLYGANTSYNDTDTVYSFADNYHPFAGITEGIYDDPANVLMTLWDGGGASDWLDASAMTRPVFIDLEPGSYSAIGTLASDPAALTETELRAGLNVGIAFGAFIENVRGGNQADEIAGNDGPNELYGGGGDDTLRGGADSDTLVGGEGNDRLYGDAGFDIYKYGTGDIAPGDGNDTISDSDGSGKVLFTVVGTGEFTLVGGKRVPGQTYYESNDGSFRYVLSGFTLAITKNGSTGSITVENFNNQRRTLGIYLDEDPSGPLPGPGGEGNNYNPESAIRRLDPLALDLDGDGFVRTVALEQSNVYFDLDGDGTAERTGWIRPEDGLLARDVNGNGFIENIGEVFGGTTGDGFADLAAFDANADGVIDATDPVFATLKVWQDANQDGISQTGEHKSLAFHQITSLSLAAVPTSIDDNGNVITATSTFIKGGVSHQLADVNLRTSATEVNPDPLRSTGGSFLSAANPEIFALPWLRGYGDVTDLHIAYDADPALRSLAQTLVSGPISGLGRDFDRLLARWSGLEAAHQAFGQTRPNGYDVDDRAWMVERFFGQTALKTEIEKIWAGQFTTVRPNATVTEARYAEIRSHYLEGFLLQTTLSSGGGYYSLAGDRFVALDNALLQQDLAQLFNGAQDAYTVGLGFKLVSKLESEGIAVDRQALIAATANAPFSAVVQQGSEGCSATSHSRLRAPTPVRPETVSSSAPLRTTRSAAVPDRGRTTSTAARETTR